MALKLKQLIQATLSADEAGNVKLFEAGTSPSGQLDELDDAHLTVATVFHRVLTASESDTQIPFGDVATAKWVMVIATNNVTVKFGGNDAARAIAVKKRGDSVYDRAYLMGDIETTSMYITEPDGATPTVTIVLAGV